jgi:hypothetical protein
MHFSQQVTIDNLEKISTEDSSFSIVDYESSETSSDGTNAQADTMLEKAENTITVILFP